uniref:Transmembrane protein family 132 middle domain-containing protein n=1 Tax=Setaria digitata TaxID=48799 RepID=A0A915PB20_9BILA
MENSEIFKKQTCKGIYLSVVSDVNAFVLFSPQHGINYNKTTIFLQDGCPSRSSSIVGTESGRRHVLPLDNIRRLDCAVMIKIASTIISLERPFVDLIAVADISILSHVRHPLCVTTQLTLLTSVTVPVSCTLSPFDSARQSCLLRIIVPYSWFPLNNGHKQNISKILISNKTGELQSITLLHSTDKECGAIGAEQHRTKITLLSPLLSYKSFDLDKQFPLLHLQLQSPTNFTFAANSLTTLLLHFDYNGSNETRFTAIKIRVWLNSHLKLLSVTSADPKLWTVQVETDTHSDSHIIFTCHYHSSSSSDDKLGRFNGYVMMMLIKIKGPAKAKSETQSNSIHSDLINVHWEVQYFLSENSTYMEKKTAKRVTTQFRIFSDFVYALLPVIKGENLVNTAVLSGKQVAIPMRIFSVTEGGNLNDVTSNSHCLSAESRVLKASPTCSSIYVDGSELRGMGRVKVHVHFETLTTSIEVTVWYPRLPITVWISDPVLNAIKDWQIAVWKWLPNKRRRKREARQFGCTNKYQQAEVRILASYYVGDKETGERIYLSGDRDILFDVTSLTVNHVHSSNIGVAVVLPRQDRIFVVAHRPGSARITVRSNTPSIDYGSAPIMVTEDVVSIRRLAVEGVVDIALDIERIPTRTHEYVVSTFIENTLTYKYQHATLVCRLYFSDEQMLELSDVPSDQYVLRGWSSDEQAIALNHGPGRHDIELIVLQNTKNVLISVSLHSPVQCSEPDSRAIVQIDYPVQIEFKEKKPISSSAISWAHIDMSYNKAIIVTYVADNSSIKLESNTNSGSWNSEVLLGLIILLAAIIGIVHAVGSRARQPFNEGYEKLVLPILTRLSSSSSCGKDENSQEWIWLSKAQIDSASINSRYSQKSTVDIAENASNATIGSTQRSISYRGSEISVFISPQPAVAINLNSLGRHTTSWRSRPRAKLTRNAMIDSRYSFSPVTSAGDEKNSWCTETITATPRQVYWRHINRDFSLDSMPDMDGVRETVT